MANRRRQVVQQQERPQTLDEAAEAVEFLQENLVVLLQRIERLEHALRAKPAGTQVDTFDVQMPAWDRAPGGGHARVSETVITEYRSTWHPWPYS